MANRAPTERLQALEKAITAADCDLYVVPMADEFQGEYIPACAARLPYVSGFTGSAGIGVFAGTPSAQLPHVLFVDGRYTLQAANEIDTARITIINSGEVSFSAWLANLDAKKLRIGFDPWLVTAQQLEQWKSAAHNVEWIALPENLVDSIWADRPAPPDGEVQLHPLEFAGTTYRDKRAALLAQMKKLQAEALILTQPDAINWLLNIRGNDIPYNPLLLGYLLLNANGASVLYTYPHDFSDEVRAYFTAHDITTAPLAEVFAGALTAPASGARILIDGATAAFGWQLLGERLGWHFIQGDDPTQLAKAVKNPVELEGIRAAHKRDGLSLTRFLHWFDQQIGRNKIPDELEVVAKLEQFRAMEPGYRGPSFATIAGSGPHGAIIHYRADAASNRRARPGELFLLDSGGQYQDGTTDVTRTIAIVGPSPAMKDHYTRVLKGHIALASAQFPVGTSGSQLDVLARQHLWAAGLDYDHGTGHGVGAYLCVHEGPQRISKRGSNVPLVPGMILSNEPGYYAADQYGIRIESLVTVIEVKSNSARPMLAFETLTLAPIDTKLIDITMLTSAERNWLNQYHARVYKTHSEHLSEDARRWLEQVTRAI